MQKISLFYFFKDQGEQILQQMQIPYKKSGDAFIVSVHSTLEALPILEKIKGHISSFEVIKGTMDDIFIEVNEGGEAIDVQLSVAQ